MRVLWLPLLILVVKRIHYYYANRQWIKRLIFLPRSQYHTSPPQPPFPIYYRTIIPYHSVVEQ